MKQTGVHEFALFLNTQAFYKQPDRLIVTDSDLINRITSVLRLKIGRRIILFDQEVAYSCVIMDISKKQISCTIIDHQSIKKMDEPLHILVPLLERDALEDVVYMATVYGVHTIQLITTQKSRKSVTEKDYSRLHKIAVAAAEQSKQFSLPIIKPLISLESFLGKNINSYQGAHRIWCDVAGNSILKVLETTQRGNSYLVTFGPEGDYTDSEKELLRTYFIPVRLTSTILRAKDAANLVMGIIRVT